LIQSQEFSAFLNVDLSQAKLEIFSIQQQQCATTNNDALVQYLQIVKAL
jgi:hypothetical protein